MRRTLLLVTAGIVIGLFVSQLLMERERAEAPVATDNAAPALVTKEKPKGEPRNELSVLQVMPNDGVSKEERVKTTPAAAPRRDRPPREEGVVISEESVSEMERQREHLRSYGYSMRTADGWKIEILEVDSVFARAGFRSGDVVTFESLDAELRKPDRVELARRMTAILEHIER